jgi:polyisoprenoid-binding protein YceI
MIKHLSLLFTAFACALPAGAEVLEYEIDPVHSGIHFKIRHFINKIPGTFTTFSGKIVYDTEDPSKSSATATIEVASIDTRNKKRDAHLQEDDYFNAAAHPTIEFASTEWIPSGEGSYTVKGTLTMHGQSHPVEMEVSYLGEMETRGTIRSGWEGKTKLDRSVWGLTSGQPAIGLDVDVELNIQAHR